MHEQDVTSRERKTLIRDSKSEADSVRIDPSLTTDISKYVTSLRKSLTSEFAPQRPIAQSSATPQSKKRKLEDGSAVNGSSGTQKWADSSLTADHVVGDVSFSIPQRKKLKLEWISGPQGGARALGADGAVEFGCGWGDIGMETLLQAK